MWRFAILTERGSTSRCAGIVGRFPCATRLGVDADVSNRHQLFNSVPGGHRDHVPERQRLHRTIFSRVSRRTISGFGAGWPSHWDRPDLIPPCGRRGAGSRSPCRMGLCHLPCDRSAHLRRVTHERHNDVCEPHSVHGLPARTCSTDGCILGRASVGESGDETHRHPRGHHWNPATVSVAHTNRSHSVTEATDQRFRAEEQRNRGRTELPAGYGHSMCNEARGLRLTSVVCFSVRAVSQSAL